MITQELCPVCNKLCDECKCLVDIIEVVNPKWPLGSYLVVNVVKKGNKQISERKENI